MDFWKTMGVLLRRWYVALPVFLVSLGLAGAVFLTVHTQYESTGTIVLTSPSGGAVAAKDPSKSVGPGNPLLDFEGSLTIAGQLLTQSLSSPAAHTTIVAEGGAGTYTAGDGNTGGPFVVVIADANSPAQAEHTVSLALDFVRTELNDRQKTLNAPPSTFIVPQNVVTPTPASTKIGGKVRAGGVALVIGLVASLTAAYGIESFKTRRRRGDEDDADKITDDDLEPDAPATAQPEDDESSTPTKKMVPAPPPRRRPVPAPAPVRTGARPSPHPVVSSLGPNPPNADFPRSNGGNGQPDGFGPGHRPHPAKPRPAPANGMAPNGSGTGANGGNGNGIGNGHNHEWPRADFRSPGTPTG